MCRAMYRGKQCRASVPFPGTPPFIPSPPQHTHQRTDVFTSPEAPYTWPFRSFNECFVMQVRLIKSLAIGDEPNLQLLMPPLSPQGLTLTTWLVFLGSQGPPMHHLINTNSRDFRSSGPGIEDKGQIFIIFYTTMASNRASKYMKQS